MIERTLVRRELYLAVPQQIYEDSFLKPAIQEFIAGQQINLLVFAPETEEVVKWITQKK